MSPAQRVGRWRGLDDRGGVDRGGQAGDPRGGHAPLIARMDVFLIPLGLPWNLLGDRLGLGGPALGVLAPAINLGILIALARRFGRKAP